MKVKTLIEILQRQNSEATVVVCDKSDFVRTGLIRPLGIDELREVQLGEVADDNVKWVCEWGQHILDAEGPIPGLLLGPR
jgi:hypothetical protein